MLSRLSLLAPRAVLRSASMSARNVMVRMPMRFPAMRVQIGLLTFFAAEHLFKAEARCMDAVDDDDDGGDDGEDDGEDGEPLCMDEVDDEEDGEDDGEDAPLEEVRPEGQSDLQLPSYVQRQK